MFKRCWSSRKSGKQPLVNVKPVSDVVVVLRFDVDEVAGGEVYPSLTLTASNAGYRDVDLGRIHSTTAAVSLV